MAKQSALTAQLLGFPTGRPRDKNVFAFIGGGGDHRMQEVGSKEVRWGSKVTGNKRSITEQFPAGNNWRSILPGHSEDAREGASLAKTPSTLGALLCSRFERKVHRKLFTIQQRPRKGGTSRRSGVGGGGMQMWLWKAAGSGGSSSRSHKDGGGDVRVPTWAGAIVGLKQMEKGI